jgi:hypothetical protein
MDDCRFDNWTRLIARLENRRAVARRLAGAVGTLLLLARTELGFAQGDDGVLDEACRANGGRCRRDVQCCSFNCRRRGGGQRNRRNQLGECRCVGEGSRCRRDRGCCAGLCRSGSCDCGETGEFCTTGNDCCSRLCQNGSCSCTRRNNRCNQNRACCSGSCGNDGFCQ